MALCLQRSEAEKGEGLMFKPSDPQAPLFDAGGLLPPAKRDRCERSWAGSFRRHALPILRGVEGEFADLFHPELGRPNRPVELVLGVEILKEMNDLTDEEALSALEFDARWWWAFQREPEELHLVQKTMHNFRVRLLTKEKSKLAFRRVTDELIEVLGVQVARQRMDSTHVLSNIAVLTRLGLICETIRVFLREVKRLEPKGYEGLPGGIRKRHGEESCYADARKAEGPRRLAVVARDLWRLVVRFEKEERITQREEWKLLKRVFEEQCEVTESPRMPGPEDDDQGEGAAQAALSDAKEVSSSSLQSPHDPAVTYSGHKGKGYEVQVAETCGEGNPVQLITEVAVTRSCESDAAATVPVVAALAAAGHKPQELVADTSYGGGKNAAGLSEMGVTLTCPAPSSSKPEEGKTYPAPPEKCPTTPKEATQWLTAREAQPEFQTNYAIRAGSEATNSEMKRAHGMRKLRVRGEERVKLAVYFKALACNFKRALRYWLSLATSPPDGVLEAAALRG